MLSRVRPRPAPPRELQPQELPFRGRKLFVIENALLLERDKFGEFGVQIGRRAGDGCGRRLPRRRPGRRDSGVVDVLGLQLRTQPPASLMRHSIERSDTLPEVIDIDEFDTLARSASAARLPACRCRRT